jgi:hypothetical protein
MQVIVANSKADRAFLHSGVVVIHDVTGNPLAIGKTALSGIMLRAYRGGFEFAKYDSFLMKVDTVKCPPLNIKDFQKLAPQYYEPASLMIRVLPWVSELKVMEIRLALDLSIVADGGELVELEEVK